jgi:Flp pilus assembly protein TadD
VARNPVRPPAQQPEAPKVGPVPVVAALLGTAIVAAAGIAWMAPVRDLDDGVPVRKPAAARSAPASDAVPLATENNSSESRAFLEPAASGALAYAAGDYEGALAQYRAAIERNPDDAESHSNLGQMLVRLERIEEALPHFDRAITLLPQRWTYHFNRARALALLERWDDAIAGYRQAQTIFPDDYATAFNLAQTLHRKGDESAAVQQYLRAIELDPSDATFRLALGISYERLEKRAEAAAAYSEYLRLLPSAADADQVRARIALLTGAS